MNAARVKGGGFAHLWKAIECYSLDEPQSDLKFTERLARENGWSLGYARRVASEYKRFMFLAVAAGHPVTPSEQVDQAWHLHLIYTQSYWDDFCGRVLGQQVHHGPTKGGREEQAKYHDWYERTKESYTRLFGDPPPADIWPLSDVRFGDDLYERRVNTRRNWIVPKPRVPRWAVVGVAIALLTVLALGTICVAPGWGCEPIDSPAEASARDAIGVTATIVIMITAIAIVIILSIVGSACANQRCSACKQWYVLSKTGKSRPADKTGETQDEWQCQHCGKTTWRDQAPTGWNCGGCGGGCSITGGSGCSAGGCGSGCSGCGGGCGGGCGS